MTGIKKIKRKKPKNTYIFFNNNNMLENAQLMEKIKSGKYKKELEIKIK